MLQTAIAQLMRAVDTPNTAPDITVIALLRIVAVLRVQVALALATTHIALALTKRTAMVTPRRAPDIVVPLTLVQATPVVATLRHVADTPPIAVLPTSAAVTPAGINPVATPMPRPARLQTTLTTLHLVALVAIHAVLRRIAVQVQITHTQLNTAYRFFSQLQAVFHTFQQQTQVAL
jgi:hypothetical protein